MTSATTTATRMNTRVGDRVRALASALRPEEFVSVSALWDPRPVQRVPATLLPTRPDHSITSLRDSRAIGSQDVGGVRID